MKVGKELDPHGAVGPWTDEDIASLGTDEEFQTRLENVVAEYGIDVLTPKLRAQYEEGLTGLTPEEMAEPSRHDPQTNMPQPRVNRPNPLDPNQDSEAWLDSNTLDMPDLKQTDYLENYRASLGQFMDEDMSISRAINDPVGDRNSEIAALMDSGQIPDQIVQGFVLNGGDLYGQLADWANYNLDTSFQTDSEEMEANMRETLKENRARNEDIFHRQGTMGAVGQFAGVGNAAMIDPVNAASMLIPPLAATKGVGFLGHTLKFASKEAAIGVAAETAIQPIVYDFKEEIESPYSVEEAVYNIMAAGAFAGAIGGVVGGAGYGINKLRNPTVSELEATIDSAFDAWDKRAVDSIIDAPEELVDTMGSLANLRRELHELAKADPDSDAIESLKAIDEMQAKMSSWREESTSIIDDLRAMDEQLDAMRELEANIDNLDAAARSQAVDNILDDLKANKNTTPEVLEEALDVKMREVIDQPAPKSMPELEPEPATRTTGTKTLYRSGDKEGAWWSDSKEYAELYGDADKTLVKEEINLNENKFFDWPEREAEGNEFLLGLSEVEMSKALAERGFAGVIIEAEDGSLIYRKNAGEQLSPKTAPKAVKPRTVGDAIEDAGSTERALADYIECRGRA